MKVSVLISAHNEEKNIRKCLNSLMHQTLLPDEIIVVAHNCTDRTREIAESFSGVRVVALEGPHGEIYPRIRGFEEAQFEVVASIDADSYAEVNWLSELIKPLASSPNVTGVGGEVRFPDSFLGKLASYDFFFLSPKYRSSYFFYFWGANFACRKSDYIKLGGLEPLLVLKDSLGLRYWAEDLYLSLLLRQQGEIVFASKALVFTKFPNLSPFAWFKRVRQQNLDKVKLLKYFSK